MVVVCGIDGSANSHEAARAAAAIARRRRDSLLLVHVQEALVFSAPVLLGAPIALANKANLDADRERLRPELAAEAERLSTAFGIEVSTAIRTGLPDHELIQAAQEVGAELIVVASLGRRAATRWRFGSVADRLSQSSPVAVLVVRDARPFERWALEERSLKTVLAIGTDRSAAAVVRAANGLCEHGPCELVEVHAYDPLHEARRLGLMEHESPDARRTIANALERELPGRFGELREAARFAAIPSRGHVAETVAEFVDGEQADLLLLGTHGWGTVHRHLLGSVSYALLPMVETNVLVVPASKDEPATRKPPGRVRSALVATDLAETGQRALDLALGLLPDGGRLVLLHVEVPPLAPLPVGMWTSYTPAVFPPPEERRVKRSLTEAELKKQIASPGRALECEVEVVEANDVPQAILAAAERHDVELICVGTHRYGRMASALIGSVARTVVRRSPRPVLLVPPPPES